MRLKRRRLMFSPIFCTSACRRASTLPAVVSSEASSSTFAGARVATSSASDCAKRTKSSFLATKSVSELSSTSAPTLPSAASQAPITPSAAMRLAALLALAPLLMRSSSSAFFRSPSHSAKAFLHSIIPRPVSSRSSFTSPALISAICEIAPYRLKKRGRSPFSRAPVAAKLAGPFILFHLDELVARGRDHLLERLRAAFEHRIGDAARIQADRPARVVVARDDVVDAVGRVVGVDDADHRNAELHRLGDRALLVADVDHEERIGQPRQVLDAAERALQLLHLARQAERFLLRHALEAAFLL